MQPSSCTEWRPGRLVLTATVLSLVLSGCLGQGDGVDSDGTGASLPTGSTARGRLEGHVTDDELVPISGANVTIEGTGLAATTDGEGAFTVDGVPPGNQTVEAVKEGYEPARHFVDVRPGSTAQAEVRLTILPSYAPHNRTLVFDGHYDCAHEIPIWTGDCMILYQAATNQSDPYTTEKFQFRFDVNARWQSFVMELAWQGAANNQLDGMRFYLEHVTNTTTEHSVKVGRADGPQNPLRFVVQRDEAHPRADPDPKTGKAATFPVNGSLAQVRVFPHGKFYNESCSVGNATIGRCMLGVGVGVGIKFTVYATVFYNERAPTGFSAIHK